MHARSRIVETWYVGFIFAGGVWVALATIALQLAVFSANVANGILSAISLVVVAGWLTAYWRITPLIRQRAEQEWDKQLDAVASPATEKAAELSRLADGLHTAALSAEKVVREFEALSKQLEADTDRRQAENKALISGTGSALVEANLTQAQIDVLLEVWEQRQERSTRSRTRKQRAFDLLMVLLGALLGYAASVIYSAEELRRLLFP